MIETAADLESALRGALTAGPPSRAALAVERKLGDRDDAIADAAALAVSSGVTPAIRVAALVLVALLATRGAPLPDRAIDALDDDVLLDRVIAAGAAAAITGIAAAAGARLDAELRRYLALRLAAAGVTGVNVAALHLSVGDLNAAGAAAAPALREPRARESRLALARLIAGWVDEHGVELAALLATRLEPVDCAAIAAASVACGVPGDHPLRIAFETRAARRRV